jgi:hypothetical protein
MKSLMTLSFTALTLSLCAYFFCLDATPAQRDMRGEKMITELIVTGRDAAPAKVENCGCKIERRAGANMELRF